jgi:DNA-binding IclR family transcriptional regulator
MASRRTDGGSQTDVAKAQTAGVNVLDKVFDLLDVLAEGQDMSVADLASRLGQPRSSIYRLLISLRQRGFVEPGADRATFRLGMEFLRFGGIVLSRFDVRKAAQPVLERINAETGETVYLCVRSGDQAVCIERIDGMFVGRAALDIGKALPLHVGATSRLLLAFEPESEWYRYVEGRELEMFTPKTVNTPDGIVTSLKRVRQEEFALSDEDVTEGMASCGAPVFDHTGRIVAAVAIGGMRQAILGSRRKSIYELMKSGAAEISAALGYGTGFLEGTSRAEG